MVGPCVGPLSNLMDFFVFQQFSFQYFRIKRRSISTSTRFTTSTILYIGLLRQVTIKKYLQALSNTGGPNSNHRERTVRTSLKDGYTYRKVRFGTSAGHCS